MNDSRTQDRAVNPFADLLGGMVADAHFELGTAPTALDVFLDGVVATAAFDLERESPSFPYRPDGPVYHVPQAVHGLDADLLGKIQAAFADVELGTFVEPKPLSPDRQKRTYSKPKRGPDDWCPGVTHFKMLLRTDGQLVKVPLPCGLQGCRECKAWWRAERRHQFEWVTDGHSEQTIVRLSGYVDDDELVKDVGAVGSTGKGQRVWAVWRNTLTYHWDGVVIFVEPLADDAIGNIARMRKNKGHDCAIETRLVTGAEFVSYLTTDKKTPGWHNPCYFVGCKTAEVSEVEYPYGDGYLVKESLAPVEVPFENEAPLDLELRPYADKPTDTDAKRRAKIRSRNRVHMRRMVPDRGVQFGLRELLSLRDARRAGESGDWFGCIVEGDYIWRKKLVIDLALALDDDGLVQMTAPDLIRGMSAYIVGVA